MRPIPNVNRCGKLLSVFSVLCPVLWSTRLKARSARTYGNFGVLELFHLQKERNCVDGLEKIRWFRAVSFVDNGDPDTCKAIYPLWIAVMLRLSGRLEAGERTYPARELAACFTCTCASAVGSAREEVRSLPHFFLSLGQQRLANGRRVRCEQQSQIIELAGGTLTMGSKS